MSGGVLLNNSGQRELDAQGRLLVENDAATCCCTPNHCWSYFQTTWDCSEGEWGPVVGYVSCTQAYNTSPQDQWIISTPFIEGHGCYAYYIHKGGSCTEFADCTIADTPDPPEASPPDPEKCHHCCCGTACALVTFSELEMPAKCHRTSFHRLIWGPFIEGSFIPTGNPNVSGCVKGDGCGFQGYVPDAITLIAFGNALDWAGNPTEVSGTALCCNGEGDSGGSTLHRACSGCLTCSDEPCPVPNQSTCSGTTQTNCWHNDFIRVEVPMGVGISVGVTPYEGGFQVCVSGEGYYTLFLGCADFAGSPCDYPDGVDVPNNACTVQDDPCGLWGGCIATGGKATVVFGGCTCQFSCFYTLSATFDCDAGTFSAVTVESATCAPAKSIPTSDWSKDDGSQTYRALIEVLGCTGDSDCTKDDWLPGIVPTGCPKKCSTLWSSENNCDGTGWLSPTAIQKRCGGPATSADWFLYFHGDSTWVYHKWVKSTTVCDVDSDCPNGTVPAVPTFQPPTCPCSCYILWEAWVRVGADFNPEVFEKYPLQKFCYNTTDVIPYDWTCIGSSDDHSYGIWRKLVAYNHPCSCGVDEECSAFDPDAPSGPVVTSVEYYDCVGCENFLLKLCGMAEGAIIRICSPFVLCLPEPVDLVFSALCSDETHCFTIESYLPDCSFHGADSGTSICAYCSGKIIYRITRIPCP